jgi:fluoride exporter
MTALLVLVGAALGAPLRYLAGHHLDGHPLDGRWPHGTLLVNLVGSAVLGALAGAAVDGDALALVGIGFCGALTTCSAFAVQSVHLGRRRGTAYALVTVAGCLAAATLGHGAAATLL